MVYAFEGCLKQMFTPLKDVVAGCSSTLTMAPLDCIFLVLPDDGKPPTEDWLTVCYSVLFGGINLAREPLDWTASNSGKQAVSSMRTKKGFTRLTVLLFFLLCASELDPSTAKAWACCCNNTTQAASVCAHDQRHTQHHTHHQHHETIHYVLF
jgi:hypothetical protein